MSDEMAEAHRRDYAYEGRLREAQTALAKLVDEPKLPRQLVAPIDELQRRLGIEREYIVRRWD